jgi:hypothetical protein
MIDGDDCGAVRGMNDLAREMEVLGENLPPAALSTTDPTYLDPGLRRGKPATNHLSYGTSSRLLDQ